MQTVSAAFTAEERDAVRSISQNLQVSWNKQSTLGSRTFTIGVSLIGGQDVIGVNPGAIGSPGSYKYFDETNYVVSMGWDRELPLPEGGISKAFAEVVLDNTSQRFTPDYLGGRSELYTAIVPRRPIIINSGFNINGQSITVPSFAGIVDKQPTVDIRQGQVGLHAADYIDFFENRKLDQSVMFTAQTTDQVLESVLSQLGMSTAQYNLDSGINVIPFGLFESGVHFSEVIQKLVQAENGYFYQDERGVFRFENRQHWDSSPYNQVQRVITTAQVLNQKVTDDSHIINIVEVKGQPREKQPNQLIYQSTGFAGAGEVLIPSGGTKEVWINFDDPVLSIDRPVASGTIGQTSFYVANSQADATGTDLTTDLYIKSIDTFATSTKITFGNTGPQGAYLVNLDIWGRPARRTGDVYYRAERQASVTAFEERPYSIDNEFIQSQSWAESFGQLMLQDFAYPENLQEITIRAIPELQQGDLISWQGRYWRVFGIKSRLDPSQGYTQDLTLLQRTINKYFRIGISTIGGTDKIAP